MTIETRPPLIDLSKLVLDERSVEKAQSNEYPPSAQEVKLTETQQLTAQIVYSGLVLNRFIDSAREELPQLRQRGAYSGTTADIKPSSEDIVIQRVAGLAEAHRIHTMVNTGEDYAESMKRFKQDWPNSNELLTRVGDMYEDLQQDKDRVFNKASETNPWIQKVNRWRAKNSVSGKIGGDQLDLLYENTDTTAEKEQEKTLAWLKTIGITIGWEALPHLGGAAAAISGLPERLAGINTDGEKVAVAIALNVAMWYLMFGPNTKGNTDMLMEDGVSITPVAKVVHEDATLNQKDEETIRQRATLAHLVNQFGWELFYGAETVGIALSSGVGNAATYSAGAAAVGVVKNLLLAGYFEVRNGHLTELIKDIKNYAGNLKKTSPYQEVAINQPIGLHDLTEGQEVTIAKNDDL
jgi:hypothetical protein